MKENLKVFIIDKETLVHIDLKTIINADWKDIKSLTEPSTKGGLQEIPDIIMSGTDSSNKFSGIRQLKSLIRKFPFSAILILSALDEWVYDILYLKAGTRSYLAKDATEQVMVSVVEFFLSCLNSKNRKEFVLTSEIGYKRSPKKINRSNISRYKDSSDGIIY